MKKRQVQLYIRLIRTRCMLNERREYYLNEYLLMSNVFLLLIFFFMLDSHNFLLRHVFIFLYFFLVFILDYEQYEKFKFCNKV